MYPHSFRSAFAPHVPNPVVSGWKLPHEPMAAEASAAGLLGWEEDDLSFMNDGDDDQDGSSAALHAMEHRRSLDIEMEELREQELANYTQTVNADVDRQTMDLLKEVESTPTAKEQATRNKINVGLKAVMGMSSWRRNSRVKVPTLAAPQLGSCAS